jgi:hypothetical protein
MSYTDYSDAPAAFDTIPDNTEAGIIINVQAGDPGVGDGCIKIAKTGAHMLNLECTITDGKFAKRKFFQALYMGHGEGARLTEGQVTGVNMSKQKLRAIVEHAKGFKPTDETPAAIAARKLGSLRDLSGMECRVIIGIEKGSEGFSDKNVIKRVVPFGKAPSDGFDAKAEAESMRKPATQPKGW